MADFSPPRIDVTRRKGGKDKRGASRDALSPRCQQVEGKEKGRKGGEGDRYIAGAKPACPSPQPSEKKEKVAEGIGKEGRNGAAGSCRTIVIGSTAR